MKRFKEQNNIEEVELDSGASLLLYKDIEDYFGKEYAVQYTAKNGTTYGKGFDNEDAVNIVFDKIYKKENLYKKLLN
jgi:hypothetical protein